MAENIPAGTPPPPQQRVSVTNVQTGVTTPVPDIRPIPTKTPDAPPPFKVGQPVTLAGHIVEIHEPQGGITSLKVQLAHGGGASWFRGEHLEPVAPPAPVVPSIPYSSNMPVEEFVKGLGADFKKRLAAFLAPPAPVAPVVKPVSDVTVVEETKQV